MASNSIVVGFNATKACRTAVKLAAAMAGRSSAALHVISVDQPVVPVGGFGWAAPYDSTAYMSDLLADRARKGAELVGEGVACTTHSELGSPSLEIVRCAKAHEAGLIVLGAAHHTALERFFIGSTADRVVRLATVPVLLAASERIGQRVLVAVDDSAFGLAALHTARGFAGTYGGEIRCLHVVEGPPPTGATIGAFDLAEYQASMTRHFEAWLADQEGEVTARAVLRVGEPVRSILDEAQDWDADLIVVGTHGRGFVGRAILGSVSEGILRRSRSSVLVVPHQEDGSG